MNRYPNLSKLDKVLYPYLVFRNEYNVAVVMRSVTSSIKDIFHNVKKQKNWITRILLYLAFSLLCVVIYPLSFIASILTYSVVALFTTVLVAIIALPIGIFYGILPFILRTKDNIKDDNNFDPDKYVGYGKLLIPLHWSVNLFSENSPFFHKTAFAPYYKAKELESDSKTHIIFTIALWMALFLSTPLYAGLAWIVSYFVIAIVVALIGFVCGSLYIVVSVFDGIQKDNDERNNGSSTNGSYGGGSK